MPNSQGYTVSQSAWALDAVENFTTAPIYTSTEAMAGSGAAGELQNDYSQCFGSSNFSSSWALSCSIDNIEGAAGPSGPDIPLRFGTRLYNSKIDTSGGANARTFAEYAVGDASLTGIPNSYSISTWVSPVPYDFSSWGPPPSGIMDLGKKYHIVSFQSSDHPTASSPPGFGYTAATCSVRLFLTGGVAVAPSVGPKPYYVGSETVVSTSYGYFVDSATSSLPVNSGSWSHILLCYDATTPDVDSEVSDRIKIYINGELSDLGNLSANQTGDESPLYGEIHPSTGAIGNNAGLDLQFKTITGSQTGPDTRYSFMNNVFQGGISEVSIFNYSLHSYNSALPALMYNNGCPPDMTTIPIFNKIAQRPVGYYRFGEVTSEVVGPVSPNGPGDTPGSSSWDPDVAPVPPATARLVNAVGHYWGESFNGDVNFYAKGDGYPVLDRADSVGVLQTYMDFKNEGPCPLGYTAADKNNLTAAPIYNRKHSLGSVFSVTHFGWSKPKSSFPSSPDYDSRTLSMPIPETSASFAAWHNQYPIAGFVGPANPAAKAVYKIPLGKIQTCGGSAEWEAGRIAGHIENGAWISSSQAPSYDTYQEYNKYMRLVNQDYSIVPEFLISNQINFYINKQKGNPLVSNPSQFEIKGASTSSMTNTPTNSSENGFYEIFSNSDFLRHFSVIKQDHKGFVSPSTIALKCKALMKFLPYDGFFPSERSLQIANQFSKSYGKFIEYSGLDSNLTSAKFRPFLTPFFRPGIIYNTIKSGLAVDFPIFTSSYQVINYKSYDANHQKSYSNYYALGTQDVYKNANIQFTASWDLRVPFEAAVEPERYLSGVKIYDLEPHPSSALDVQARWSGEGDDLYKRMMHNYLAAIPEFFLPDGEFTCLKSKPEREFATVQSGTSYGMRIKLRRTMNKARQWRTYANNESTITYDVPQDPRVLAGDSENLRETFTMYSRPSSFGPPVAGTTYLGFRSSTGPNKIQNVDYNTNLYPSDSLMGINPSFTPPYYGRESWADVIYKAETSGPVTIDEIFSNATVNLWGIDTDPILNGVTSSTTGTLYGTNRQQSIWSGDEDQGTVDYNSPMRSSYANSYAMKLDSSFNLLGKNGDRWVIEPKFETPHYNFNSETSIRPITSASNTLTIPTNGSESVPRGMWHQFGTMESEKGIYIEVDGIPTKWRTTRGYADPRRTITPSSPKALKTELLSGIDLSAYQNDKFEDLSKLTGFETGKKLGNTAKSLTVYEAVVAVPFIIKGGEKQFFQIPEDTIRKALGDLNTISSDKSVSQSGLAIKSALKGLENNSDLFDNKDDLKAAKVRTAASAASAATANQLNRDEDTANNVSDTIKDMVSKMKKYVFPPNMDFVQNIGKVTPFAMYVFEFDYTFTQEDLMYMWQNVSPPERKVKFARKEVEISHKLLANELMGSFGEEDNDPIKEGLQWMVFKVKQRANNNYFSKVSRDTGPKTEQFPFSYNWPYDFFSLVEFVNMDTKIGFGQGLQDGGIDEEVAEVAENPLKVSKTAEQTVGRPKRKKKTGKRKR